MPLFNIVIVLSFIDLPRNEKIHNNHVTKEKKKPTVLISYIHVCLTQWMPGLQLYWPLFIGFSLLSVLHTVPRTIFRKKELKAKTTKLNKIGKNKHRTIMYIN